MGFEAFTAIHFYDFLNSNNRLKCKHCKMLKVKVFESVSDKNARSGRKAEQRTQINVLLRSLILLLVLSPSDIKYNFLVKDISDRSRNSNSLTKGIMTKHVLKYRQSYCNITPK